MLLPGTGRAPDPSFALERYRALAAGYDASCRYSRGIRRLAVEALALRAGDTVFDVGCGTGLLLPELAARVGPRGRVVGIEQCPEMAAHAQRRIERHRLANTELLIVPAARADPSQRAGALLFCFTHDVLQSAAALANLFTHAEPGARVVLAGSKLANGWGSRLLNSWKLRRLEPYLTTRTGLERPWAPVERYCPDLELLRSCHFGTAYLAVGSLAHCVDAGQAPGRARSRIAA